MHTFLVSFVLTLTSFHSTMEPTQVLNSFLLGAKTTFTSWDEPWQKEVIADADTLVRVEITDAQPERVEFNVLKQIAGDEIAEKGAIVGFSKLRFSSYSVKEDVFSLTKGSVYYIFLENAEGENEYHIATPTSGFAVTSDGQTIATYRHSLHQAYASSDVSDFEPFCAQHVALELIYYIGGVELESLEPFLKHKGFHVQASAVRALGKLDRKVSQERLLTFIADPTREPFAKVMAIWALRDMNAKDAVADLKEILASTEDEASELGMNLMDPRIGTSFPNSVHEGIQHLIKTWEEEGKQMDQP